MLAQYPTLPHDPCLALPCLDYLASVTSTNAILHFTITLRTVEGAAPLPNKSVGARHVTTPHGRGHRGFITATGKAPSSTKSSFRLLFLLVVLRSDFTDRNTTRHGRNMKKCYFSTIFNMDQHFSENKATFKQCLDDRGRAIVCFRSKHLPNIRTRHRFKGKLSVRFSHELFPMSLLL